MLRLAMKQAALGALIAAMLVAAGGLAQAGCLPWKAAGPLIAQHSLIPGNVIYQMVQSRLGGKIISATLCESGGNFVYRIVVLGKKGDVANLTVDARTGRF
jgi:uncharacterized membrane protein YkoI